MNKNKSLLFQSTEIGALTLKNRIFMSAAASYNADENGDIDYSQKILHFEVAKGGCALVPTGGVSGTHPNGRTNGTRPMFDCDERIPSFKKFADTIKTNGAAAFLQLTHGGASAARYQLSIGNKPFMASHYLKDAKAGFDRENLEDCPASEEEIRDVVSAFGDASVRAKKAGFDGIQIHAAHESMLAQWLSPLYNQRSDSWGGSVQNRCRIHAEILRDIKEKAGKKFPVVVKLGIEDVFPGGTTAEEGILAAKYLAEQGNVDVIEVSQGLQDISDMNKTCMRNGITSPEKEAYFRSWTRKVKVAVKEYALVTMQGGLRTPALMEEILENGEADFVSMCRPYICEPDIINRWQNGDMTKSRCVSCNACIFKHILHNKPHACVLQDDLC